MFLSEMVKKDVCLMGGSKQNALSFQKCALRKASVPAMSRTDFDSKNVTSHGSMKLEKSFQIVRGKQWRYIYNV